MTGVILMYDDLEGGKESISVLRSNCWESCTFFISLNLFVVCGGRLIANNKAQQLFSHAKYGDQNYDNKEECDWLIWADDGEYKVRFRFLTFEVEDEADCG